VVPFLRAVPSLDEGLSQLPPPMTPILEISTSERSATVTVNLLLTRQMPVPLQPLKSTSSSVTPENANLINSMGAAGSQYWKPQSITDMPLTLMASPQPPIKGRSSVSSQSTAEKTALLSLKTRTRNTLRKIITDRRFWK